MANPVALVTGSSRGIGLAVARALGRAGHHVVLAARSAEQLAHARQELATQGIAATACAVDLRQRGAAATALACTQQVGDLEVLVDNAGTAPTAKFEATTDELLDEALDLHVRAPLALIRGALPAMRARDRGCIVQLASTAGLRGFPFTAAYTAAKHAMVGLARVLALELRGTQLRSYAVCPGFVDTAITREAAAKIAARGRTDAATAFRQMAAQNRIGRMHTADEVADAVAWLVAQRPSGCVFELDRDPPTFVE